MKKFLIIFFGLLLQSCISIPQQEVASFDRFGTSQDLAFFRDTLPVVIRFDGNYNTGNLKQRERYRQELLANTQRYFSERGIKVIDLSYQPVKPSEYLDITLIVDHPIQERKEDRGGWQKFTGFWSLLSLGILPSVGGDTDLYLILKRVQFNQVVVETRLSGATRAYKSSLFIPLSPFYSESKGIAKAYSNLLDNSFDLEVVK